MTGRVEGKRVIVVGAGQTPGDTIGNGKAAALLFAREGAAIVCIDRFYERAAETAESIVAGGGVAHAVQADVTSAEDCETAVAKAIEALGGVDILINNVGVGGADGPAHRIEEQVFDHTLSVNLKGMWLMTRAVLRPMRDKEYGSIVNISSIAAVAGGIQLAYEVSKAGVNRLTTSVAMSNARRGVRCNAIMPGLMDTPMALNAAAAARGETHSQARERRNAQVPLRHRMGTAWDTAQAALFLGSDEAGFITGAILPVDGGMALPR